MLTAGQLFGHYEVIEKLGEGGMGVVYKARDVRLNRLVAIKLLPPDKFADKDQIRRFQFEAHAASNLNHPNIVVIYDVGTEESVYYLAMEYVNGKPLSELIPHKGMRLAEALKIAVQIADGVGAAAAAGIVHRDLKPGNIMITESGSVKVLDFGIAKSIGFGRENGSTIALDEEPRTKEGSMVGTVAYMSPEQAEGKPLDARSDIFSFGSVLYEMVTGRPAFRAETTASTVSAILRDDPFPAGQVTADVPEELETVIQRCLRKDPNRRFQTILDVRVCLLELMEDLQAGITPVRTSRKPAAGLGRYWKAALAMGAIVVALLLAWMGRALLRPSNKEMPAEVQITPFANYEGFMGYPAFSQDGNQLAFVWTGGAGVTTHIYVKVIGTEYPLQVTSGELPDSHPAFAPDNRSIAFLRVLSKEATGVYQVSPLGGPVRLIAEIPTTLYQGLTWSGDGKWLVTSAYARPQGPSRIVVISSTDGRSRSLDFGSTKDEFGGVLSADGRKLAFVRIRSYSDWEIHIAPVNEKLELTGPIVRLNAPEGLNRQPAWTTDSKDIVFANGGTSTTRLWRVSATSGARAQQLPLAGDTVYQPVIASTGHRLAFTHDFDNANIWKLSVTADGRVRDAVAIASSARSSYVRPHAYSSDGTKIAFESSRSGSYGIWKANADGSGATLLFSNGLINSGSPTWSKDDRWIAFDMRNGRNAHIFVISAEGGSLRTVTQGSSDNILPAWSHDGKWIYFDSNRTGRFEVFKCSPEGGEPIQVTHEGGWGVQESRDGKSLYYTRTRDVSTSLMTMPAAGGAESMVLPAVHERWWAVADKGVWYMEREGPEMDPGLWSMESPVSGRATLRFLDFVTRRIAPANIIPRTPTGSVAISPDQRTILVSEVDHRGYEIGLAEGFQ